MHKRKLFLVTFFVAHCCRVALYDIQLMKKFALKNSKKSSVDPKGFFIVKKLIEEVMVVRTRLQSLQWDLTEIRTSVYLEVNTHMFSFERS